MISVMIVDDEKTIREGVERAIDWEGLGMRVCVSAASGAEALDAIELAPPDIVLLDIVLNDIDGLEVLDLIRRKYPGMYVILISGHDDFEYARRAIELNAYSYLLKPIDIEQLLEKLLQIRVAIAERLDKLKKDKELNDRLTDSIPIIRDSFFIGLVSGKRDSAESIVAAAEFLGVDLTARQHAVAVLELHNPGNGNEYDRNLIRYAAMDICREAFSGAYKCHPFGIEDKIGILISADEMEPQNIRDICNFIRDGVNVKLGVPLTVGIGRPQSDPVCIQHSYGEAVEALEYKLIMGLNRIIDSEIIYQSANKKLERNLIREVFQKKGDELKIALKTMNRQAADAIADEIMAALRASIGSNMRNHSRDLFLISTYLSVAAADLDVDMESILDEGRELYGAFKSQDTLEKLHECIRSFFTKVMEELGNKQKSSNSLYVRKALQYIRENLYGEISLSAIADALYLSPNYLSRIFRQEAGESFIEYTIRVKMNEVKRLLEQSPQKVYEIAYKLNYKDVNYFSKTFKRFFGVSPSEYRELQSQNQDGGIEL